MTPHEIRTLYLDFFKAKGHKIVRSDSLIPSKDPTLLFTTAGMVQFKSLYAGAPLKFSTASSCQKCLRAGGKNSDLENVGQTLRHHTFFEMLGNFSFGDYFKKQAIEYAMEFLLNVLKMDLSKLWVSVFENDDEAKEIWIKAGFPEDRIVKLGAKDNFWGPAGSEGACGPCSEIYFDLGPSHSCNSSECRVGCDCERYLEFWNLVFPQFYQEENGTRRALERKGVDTGMGLERISFLMDPNAENNYETKVFKPIIDKIKTLTDINYDSLNKSSFHVISDHVRALTFALGDGVLPSNEGRGYVMRRILRRALRFGHKIGLHKSFLHTLVPFVTEEMKCQYPELEKTRAMTVEVIKNEEEKFITTLQKGIGLLDECIKKLKEQNNNIISGDIIFKLYDTYGFPLELIFEIASEKDFIVDENGFKKCMENQKLKGKSSWKGKAFSIDVIEKIIKDSFPATEFNGYEKTETSAEVLGIISGDKLVDEVKENENCIVILDNSPIYAESGGQVSDSGKISWEGGYALVIDVNKSDGGIFLHHIQIQKGMLKPESIIKVYADKNKRFEIQKHHTATHILQYVLRKLLGEHIKQAGSFVDEKRLRFDFSHSKRLDEGELISIEKEVNEIILNNEQVIYNTMSLETAKSDSAILANFGDKYEDEVRMVNIGNFSRELCGGIHIPMTGLINGFSIISESSVSAGIRRIEAVVGNAFIKRSLRQSYDIKHIAFSLKVPENKIIEKTEIQLKKIKELEKKLKDRSTNQKSSASPSVDLSFNENEIQIFIKGYKDLTSSDLLQIQDKLKNEGEKSVIFLGSISNNQIFYSSYQKGVSDISCNDLMNEVTKISEGKGGGRAEMARGASKNIIKFEESLQYAKSFIKSRM